jgi:hypothetical protein
MLTKWVRGLRSASVNEKLMKLTGLDKQHLNLVKLSACESPKAALSTNLDDVLLFYPNCCDSRESKELLAGLSQLARGDVSAVRVIMNIYFEGKARPAAPADTSPVRQGRGGRQSPFPGPGGHSLGDPFLVSVAANRFLTGGQRMRRATATMKAEALSEGAICTVIHKLLNLWRSSWSFEKEFTVMALRSCLKMVQEDSYRANPNVQGIWTTLCSCPELPILVEHISKETVAPSPVAVFKDLFKLVSETFGGSVCSEDESLMASANESWAAVLVLVFGCRAFQFAIVGVF